MNRYGNRYIVPLLTPQGPFGVEVIPGNELGVRTVVLTPYGPVVISHDASSDLEAKYGPQWMYEKGGKVAAFANAVIAQAKAKYDGGDVLERV